MLGNILPCSLDYRQGSANGNAQILSRLPQPAIDFERTEPGRLTSADAVGIYFIRACGFYPRKPSKPGIGLSDGLVPPSSSPIGSFPPLPFTDQDVRDFRRHGPRKDIIGRLRPPNPFVAMSSAQYIAAESPCSVSDDRQSAKDAAAELPCSFSAGPHCAQELAAKLPCSIPVDRRFSHDRRQITLQRVRRHIL